MRRIANGEVLVAGYNACSSIMFQPSPFDFTLSNESPTHTPLRHDFLYLVLFYKTPLTLLPSLRPGKLLLMVLDSSTGVFGLSKNTSYTSFFSLPPFPPLGELGVTARETSYQRLDLLRMARLYRNGFGSRLARPFMGTDDSYMSHVSS